MKRILLSMLALGAMTSCANQEIAEVPANPDRTPIDLQAGVQAVTRAGTGPVASGEFTFGIAGWETKEATPTYTVAPSWTHTAQGDASAVKPTVWTDTQPYYNADNATKTHMLAWYPAGTLTAGKVSFTDHDGLVDVMVANKISGSKDGAASALIFEHKTTQLVFKVKKGAGLIAGTTLTSITIKSAETPNGIDFTAADPAVTYSAAASFTVPGITSVAIDAEATAGKAVMLKPISTNSFTVDVVTSTGTFTDVAVTTTDPSFLVGKAYTVVLTFNQKAISMDSSVSPWIPGAGTGTVE